MRQFLDISIKTFFQVPLPHSEHQANTKSSILGLVFRGSEYLLEIYVITQPENNEPLELIKCENTYLMEALF